MVVNGQQLSQAIKSMRDFLGDVSQLLRTAEALMGERSWDVTTNSGCLYDLSYSVNTGHLWMPREAVRTFKNDSYPQIVSMIAVLLDDYQRKGYKLEEPVVSASYFVFPKGIPEDKIKVDFYQSQQFGWCEAGLDGIPEEMDEKDKYWEESYIWTYMQVLGRPLVEIKNQDLLRERIVHPLLDLIEKKTKAE